MAHYEEWRLRQITRRRAVALGHLAAGRTEREAAAEMGITREGFRSLVKDLRQITGILRGRDMGAWWRQHSAHWVLLMAQDVGCNLDRLIVLTAKHAGKTSDA